MKIECAPPRRAYGRQALSRLPWALAVAASLLACGPSSADDPAAEASTQGAATPAGYPAGSPAGESVRAGTPGGRRAQEAEAREAKASKISPEDQAAIAKLPPARSGSDEVLFPPGDDNLMTPLVGEKTFSDEAIEINPFELMPRDLPIEDEHRAEIYELLVEMQPLRLDLTSDHHDRQYILNLRRLEALEKDDRPEVGWAALHAFTRYPGQDFQVRRTLLRVGARVSPNEAAPLLKDLAFTYGHRMGDRAEALLYLAEVDPAALMEGARPYLERPGKRFQTAPSDEFFARAWNSACEKSQVSPVPMMSQVAMNIALEPIARYVAIDELAKHADDPLAKATLQEALVESTGDGYLRRKAAQGIIRGFPAEEACVLLAETLRREADVNMARFLDDMIQTNCR